MNLIERVELLLRFEDISLLKNVQKEILDYEIENKVNIEEEYVLKYLCSTIISTIYRLNAAKETDLVVDIKSFINSNLAIIHKWKSLTVQMITENIRSNIKKEYDKKLDEKINEATNLVTALDTIVEEKENEFLNSIEKTFEDIDLKTQIAKVSTVELMDAKTKALIKQSILQFNFFKFAKAACKIASYFGPKTMLISGVINIGLETIEGSIL